MKRNEKVISQADGVKFVIDLKEFPHGELDCVRKDEQYDIEFYRVPEGITVPSYNHETSQVEWMPVKYWSIHRGKKLEIVTLADGSQIYTDNDPRAIYGIACDAETCEPQRFTPSDALARKVLVPISSGILADDLKDCWYDFDTGLIGPKQESTHSCSVGFSFGQFIGLMVGDGWASGNEVYLSDNEGYNAEFISGFLRIAYPGSSYLTKDVFRKAELPGRYGDTARYWLNGGKSIFANRIRELVDGHGDNQTSGSANKRLPVWYQFGGEEFIRGLICGMIATDGTVAVSNGKGKPQLQIQYNTTSLQLAREFQRCCRLLGVRCSVEFSKRTSGGNAAWLCIVSTVDAKKIGLLDKCCHTRKRDLFVNTEVKTDGQFVKNDFIPFPKCLSSEIVRLIPNPYRPDTPEAKKLQSICIGTRHYAAEGRISRSVVRDISAYAAQQAEAAEAVCSKCDAAFNALYPQAEQTKSSLEVSAEIAEILRKGTESRKSRLHSFKEASAILKMLYLVRKTGKMTCRQACAFKEFITSVPPATELRDSQALKKLVKMAESPIRWEYIEKIDKTEVEEVGYDLTVPGYDTFSNADGVILSNTVNIHLPASEKASKEALEKMLPSKNLFSLTDMKSVRYKPEKEQVSGLWALTAGVSQKPVRVFRTKSDAIKAYRNGEIAHDDPIEIRS